MVASRTRKTRSKLIPVANSVLNSVGKIASQGAESTFRTLATNHSGSDLTSSFMENQQNIRYNLASMELGNRRMNRRLERHARLIHTGSDDNLLEIAFGWLIDHLLYLLDLLWGFISPILMQLAISLFTIFAIIAIIAIIACNVIFFGAIYLFLTS